MTIFVKSFEIHCSYLLGMIYVYFICIFENPIVCFDGFREQVECKLTFLGLVVLENQLKVETAPVIAALNDANIRTIMVTGKFL